MAALSGCPVGIASGDDAGAGGSTAGGSTAGGSTAGGSAAGGSTAGGSTAGGSTAGGSTAGGSTAGGSTAGGSTAGGSTAGGSTPNDAGPFDAGVGDGGVPAFIRQAPLGEWSAMSGNTLTSVAFDYSATPPPSGFRTSLQGLMDAWSGGIYVPQHHRLYVNGGGHRDYDGNEWYAFNLETGRWERVNDPSLFLESSATNGVFPDGAPLPIHTYDVLGYLPTTNSLYRLGRGGSPLAHVWQFSLNSRQWTNTTLPVGDPSSGTAKLIPGTSTFLLLENNSQAAGYASVEVVDPVARSKTQRRMYGPSMRTVTSTVDTLAGEVVFVGTGLAPRRVVISTGVDSTVTTSGDARLEAIPAPGFVYDSRRDRFVGWGAGAPRDLFVLAKGSWAWSVVTPTSGATPGAANGNGVFGRFAYVPEYDVFLLVTSVSGPAHFYKPPDWAL